MAEEQANNQPNQAPAQQQAAQDAPAAVPKAPMNPLDDKQAAQAYESDILKNIVETETSEGPEQILDLAPDVDTSLLEEIEPSKSIVLLLLKTFFIILLVGSFVSLMFFSSQLTNRLDRITQLVGAPNASNDLADTNSEVLDLQTTLNFFRYLQLKSLLDQFTFDGDAYIHFFNISNSQTASASAKNEANNELSKLRPQLEETFLAINDLYAQPFSAPLIDLELEDAEREQMFVQALRERFTEKISELASLAGGETSSEQKLHQQTLRLVGNGALSGHFLRADLSEMTVQELYDFIKTANQLVVNDLSIISSIKNERVKWSDVMNEIELRTIAVDRNYSDNFYDEIGGIRYNSYEFDQNGPSITIVGDTKRFDTTNFTMISNLIDSLNSSDFFENAEMRSFTKSGSLDAGYTASLRLHLDLENLGGTDEETN